MRARRVSLPLTMILGLGLAACGCRVVERGDLVGSYTAVHGFGTVERLTLNADGRFQQVIEPLGKPPTLHGGTWEFDPASGVWGSVKLLKCMMIADGLGRPLDAPRIVGCGFPVEREYGLGAIRLGIDEGSPPYRKVN